MKKNSYQEFIVAGIAGLTGIFILAMSWAEYKTVAQEHPSIRIFVLGLVLLFMAAGNLGVGLKKRAWLKKMKKQENTTTDCILSNEVTPSIEK
jgi:invasion protein IalB